MKIKKSDQILLNEKGLLKFLVLIEFSARLVAVLILWHFEPDVKYFSTIVKITPSTPRNYYHFQFHLYRFQFN